MSHPLRDNEVRGSRVQGKTVGCYTGREESFVNRNSPTPFPVFIAFAIVHHSDDVLERLLDANGECVLVP